MKSLITVALIVAMVTLPLVATADYNQGFDSGVDIGNTASQWWHPIEQYSQWSTNSYQACEDYWPPSTYLVEFSGCLNGVEWVYQQWL